MIDQWNVVCPECEGLHGCDSYDGTSEVPNPALVAELTRLRRLKELAREFVISLGRPDSFTATTPLRELIFALADTPETPGRFKEPVATERKEGEA